MHNDTWTDSSPWVAIADESPARDVLARTLSDDGYYVDSYPSIECMLEALDQARARGRTPALILTDVPRPDWLGLRVLRELRRQGFCAPVVVMTTFGSEEKLNDAFAAGANMGVGKAFSTAR